MALLVDGNISSVGDLQAYDSAVLETARNEGIDLEQKCKLATQEIAGELTAFLLRHKERIAVTASGEPDLGAVVVTPALKLWHVLRSLTLIYGDGSSNLVHDRFQKKLRHLEQQAKKAADMLFETGVGITSSPIGRAKAPEVVTGGVGGAAATYAISVSWQNSRGERGAPSEPVIGKVADGEGFLVRAVEPPLSGMTYDVYAGASGALMTQQNSTPLEVGSWWTLPPSGLTVGLPPGDGQQPDYWVRHERVLRRG